MPARKKLRIITIVYWFLLLYMVAALVWWYIALNRQANEMAALKLSEIAAGDPAYSRKAAAVADFKRRKKAQYTGEGSIFFLIIAVGAVFVYRAIKKQWQLSEQQQNFMMAVTHELKTPIAIARLNIETLRKRKLDTARQDDLLKATLDETERLNALTSNILLASRMDTGKYEMMTENINLETLLQELKQQAGRRYPNRVFNWIAQPALYIRGDALQLKLMISNLVDNAIKYAPESAIDIEAHKAQHVYITVSDQGPGIPPAERERIFEKFYRMGSEDTRNTKGTGLGLYLCKAIVKAHHGKIWVADNEPQGAVFTVVLPSAD